MPVATAGIPACPARTGARPALADCFQWQASGLPIEYRSFDRYSPQGRQECLPYLQAGSPVLHFFRLRSGKTRIQVTTAREHRAVGLCSISSGSALRAQAQGLHLLIAFNGRPPACL